MGRFLHGFLHVVLGLVQVINVSALPPKWQPLAVAIVAAAQGYLGVHNHEKE